MAGAGVPAAADASSGVASSPAPMTPSVVKMTSGHSWKELAGDADESFFMAGASIRSYYALRPTPYASRLATGRRRGRRRYKTLSRSAGLLARGSFSRSAAARRAAAGRARRGVARAERRTAGSGGSLPGRRNPAPSPRAPACEASGSARRASVGQAATQAGFGLQASGLRPVRCQRPRSSFSFRDPLTAECWQKSHFVITPFAAS